MSMYTTELAFVTDFSFASYIFKVLYMRAYKERSTRNKGENEYAEKRTC